MTSHSHQGIGSSPGDGLLSLVNPPCSVSIDKISAGRWRQQEALGLTPCSRDRGRVHAHRVLHQR